MSTPICAQYLRLKQPFRDAVLLFRLGDFYEMYDHDATIAARQTVGTNGIVLTFAVRLPLWREATRRYQRRDRRGPTPAGPEGAP